MHRHILILLLCTGLSACGGDGPGAEGGSGDTAIADSAPREVHFTATDFAFQGPQTIEAGLVTLALSNEGETLHHLQLVRLPENMSMAEFQQAMSQMQPGTPPPPWFEEVGGVNPPTPGQPARVTLHLEAGEYAVLCFVDTPDKVPHVMKGMMQPLTVTPSSTPAAPLPESDLSLTLVDYAFSFSEPPTRGTHVIRVENTATQAHEIVLVRLLPEKTMDDLMAWAATYEGPEPFVPIGGVPGIESGQAVNVEVTFAEGDHVALCFIPDATDGAPHIVHGMILPFTVS